MSDSIKVAIKVRPLIKREKDDNLGIQWTIQGNSIVSTDQEVKKRGDGGFYFDHIFDMNASNLDVFDTVVKPIVNAAVNGFNGTVFAYGQTSSGKTYTMMGTAEEMGIVPLAVQHMFDAIANTSGREFLLRVSYLEIYNERVNDLLNKSGTDLKLKEDSSGQVILQCKEEITNSPENVLSIMKKGDKNRRIGETNMNERSSRSHTIFRITIESREAGDSNSAIQVSQLNLVDLAGSERARQTGATGERFKEGRHINMSLSTLGLVIMQLSESQDGQKHVNFRDSKLTRLLQNSLGGNAMTAIICAVTPAALEETQCTLSFASRAKSVKNKPQINEVMSDAALLKRYARQLAKLQEELQRIKIENRSAEVEEMETRLQEKDRINQLLEERIELLKTRIVSGDNIAQESFKCKLKRRQTWGGPGVFNQHLPIFQTKTGLPTIKEVSFETPQKKSTIQSIDIMNQTFQTAFTDFELELFESERDRESRESDSDEDYFVTKRRNRVTFVDDVYNIKSKNSGIDITPEKSNTSTQTVSYLMSPSTPKHVLRRCISQLTKEFVELREFTTLEKQLTCQGNHCCAREEKEQQTEQIKSSLECYKLEYVTEVKEQLAALNLAEETNLESIITKLCTKLNEIQKQNILEKESNSKTMKQFSELEKRIENITSERNEFEYISRELRAELKKKTTELELKIMSEENMKKEEMTKISELEKQMESIISEKNKFECMNAVLSNESTKKIMELQKQIENVTSERNEFEHMRRELHIELNKKSIELEKLKNNLEKSANTEIINNKITELEAEIENITSENNTFKHMNDDLRAKLNQISLEFESEIASEQTEKQKAIEKVSELEKHIEQLNSNKKEYDCTNVELKNELHNKITDLEFKIKSEHTLKQEAMDKILTLEKRIENITCEKNEFVRINNECNKNISELKTTIMSQQTAYQEANNKISELEEKLKSTILEKNEFQRTNNELNIEFNKKCSELEAQTMHKEADNLKAIEKMSELEKQIMSIRSEKNELERVNNELHIELEQKDSELNNKMVAEQIQNQKTVEKISELEKQIENITSQKDEYERVNIELRAQLDAKISEFNSYIKQSKAENQDLTEKVSKLENQITSVSSENNELQRINNELRVELSRTTFELNPKTVEQTEYQDATRKILELEKQVADTMSEKNELYCIDQQLCIKKTCILKAKVTSEEIEKQKIIEMPDQLNIDNITDDNSTKDEFNHIISELRTELDQKTSALKLEQIENQKGIKMISDLNKKIECILSERNEFENLYNQLNAELKKKASGLESTIVLEQTTTSELKEQMENITSENNELKDIEEIHDGSNDKNMELKLRRNTIKDLQDVITDLQTVNQDLEDQYQSFLGSESVLSSSKMNGSNADTSYVILNMEAEKSQLEGTLQLKSQELEDIKRDVQSLKTDINKLQETIYLLTTENMEMATKLTIEQENAKQSEVNLQKTIDELYARISEVTNEKITLESDLTALNDQLESMRSKMSVVYNEEQLLESYRNKIDKLTTENIELSTSITEKNKELENIKESKSLLYDHDCIYTKKIAILQEKNEYLLAENNELSTDLIDKIEENDMLKEQCDILKNKIEQSLSINEHVADNDVEHVKMENNILKAEIAELKTKVTILSEENTKLSTNLLETLDNFDSSQNEKSYNSTLHLSKIFNNSRDINEIEYEVSQEETRETLANEVIALQNKIDYLTRLNKKLSDLKLTSCSQCVHLRNLNESHRILKLEAKGLNQKLEDLQRKFDRKCADIEILKNKIRQELNLSVHDVSSNVIFVDEMNVSFVEERIQSLNNELQILKTEHNKILVLYEDKCDEVKQLHSGMIADESNTNDSTSKKIPNRAGNRIEQIQNHIDHIKSDMDEIKENSMNFTVMLNEFKTEKANLLDQINNLKDTNEELRKTILNNESTAIKKLQILENELTNTNREIEQFSIQEKELESQKLILEVELEGLKHKEQDKNALINQLNEHIFSLKKELENKEDLQYLKEQCDKLEKDKVLSKELEQHNMLKIKELEVCINDLQKTLTNQECFFRELQEKAIYMEKLLQEKEQEIYILTQKLQAAETEVINIKNTLEMKYKNEFDSVVQHHIKEYENNMQKLNDTLNKYIDENLNLSQELTSLRNVKEKLNEIVAEKECLFDHQKMLVHDNEKLHDELDEIRKCIIKELRSLKYNVNLQEFPSKSVTEIFVLLLQTLVSKESEVIKTMRETCEKERQKIEEEKQQCINTEKRTITWAKELEGEIEKLQADLMEKEHAHKEYQNTISQLEHLLKENIYEKEIFKEKMEALETDFNNLQVEFDKQCKVDNQQEEAILIAQKKEKEVHEMFKTKETELQSKHKLEKEMYEKKIDNLVQTLEFYKTRNLELNNTIEGLEANERQLKNTIEVNLTEIKKYSQNVKKVNTELEQLTQAYNEVNQEIEQKNLHIEEITTVLKSKCDILSEYKIKFETIVPECEMLKEHVKDQKLSIEQRKEEIDMLRKEREEQLEIIKDKLNSEEIKNFGLSKQLNELNNKNVTLIDELNSLKEKYEELQGENAKLERKIRNSTSKIKAEAEIEELKELNKRLQNNLEGASNRVVEFQEIRNQTLKDLVDVKGKYEFLMQENDELKKALSLYKSKHSNSSLLIDEGKYDALLLEKNKIALELEDKKIILSQKDKEVKEYISQVQELTDRNKELDDELEEYAAIIRERDIEISKLEDKLYSRLSENVLVNEAEEKLKNLNEENEKLRDQVEALKMRLQMDVEKDIELQNESIIRVLKKENLELQAKINFYKLQIDGIESKEIRTNQLKNLDKRLENNLEEPSNSVKELEGEKNKIIKELETHKLLLNQKDKELKECINKLRDLTMKNRELNNELEEYVRTIRNRDAEISNLKVNLGSQSTQNESDSNIRQKLDFFIIENKKLKNEIKELRMRSRIEAHDESILKSSTRKQNRTVISDRDEYEDKYEQLKKKIHELELQLVSKNGKIATLEIQIQSESFPYQKKCKELEELVLAFRNKNAELNNEVRKLRRTLNDVNAWECDVCRRWRVNRKDQACQTIPNNTVRFCSTNSGVVEDHVKIQKLEKEKMLMKDLCRSRSRQIKELQDRIQELEAQSSFALRSNEVLQDRSNQQDSSIIRHNRHLDIGKNLKP